ncbi:MAG TPA: RpiB/LacA/LacB family sugar-phosphate isomerase, partial [Pelovirga sp.]|nr:RpiB/LacA/LacB family sugar-phosphate isomerase [Pelovirga sp.]
MIAVASDHGGLDLKNAILASLREQQIECVDLGTEGTASVDYPDFAEKVALAVSSGIAKAGILICGTGIGMSIAANKIPGIRAALV